MTCFEVDAALKSMKILVDTREQDTPALRRRIKAMECGVERVKLDVGDYSCKCTLPDGSVYSLENDVVVERKMNADELCQCFTKGRARFQREFERAAASGTKVYLLIEEANWETIFDGEYRSRLNPDALTASICAWAARYNINVIFCNARTSGLLIKRLLRYELKERLERGDADEVSGTA